MKIFNFKRVIKVNERVGYSEYKEVEKEVLNIPKIVVFSIIGLFILITLLCSFTTIKSGQVGLKIRFGKIVDISLSEGFNFKIPYVEKIAKVNIKVQKAEVETSGATKDLQDIKTKIAVNFKVDGKQASYLYKTVGNNYKDTVLIPAVQESIKAVLAKYTAEEVITKRNEVSNECLNALQEKVKNYGLIIDNFNITDFNFSQAFNDAIEAKQVAEQEVLKAQQELEKAKVDAEKKVAEAKAEAEALKVQKQEITEELLRLREIESQLKAIEKWNGQLPSTITGDTVPFINIGN